MSHPQQRAFVRSIRGRFPTFFVGQRVLEVGSLEMKGKNNGCVRGFFSGCDYTGLDLREGPGVDVVCPGQDYGAPDNAFDVVISCEVMEHNPHWRETFENMIRLCRPGGLVIMTCACLGRPEHGTTRTSKAQAPLMPWEYYRNLTAKDLSSALHIKKFFSECRFFENFDFCDLYFVGFKAGRAAPANAKRALFSLRTHYYVENLRRQGALRRRFLIAAFGEARYMAGPIRVRPFG
jgi:SAM-dependent methyltransferase